MPNARISRRSAPPTDAAASAGPRAGWTVMVYLCGDNDLEPSAVADIREMKRVGSSDDLNVLVQFDRYHRGQPTRRYRVRAGTALGDDAVGDPLGETNTGDPDVLLDFARWGTNEYPARHYMLVIWNHGMGWDDTDVYETAVRGMGLTVTHAGSPLAGPHEDEPVAPSRARARFAPGAVTAAAAARGLSTGRARARAADGGHEVPVGALRWASDRAGNALFSTTVGTALTRAIGFDDHQKDFLDNGELRRVLEQLHATIGRPLDVLGLDACLMSMVEVLYELRRHARFAVASEETIPLAGWPYERVLSFLRDHPEAEPRDLADRIVAEFIASYAKNRRVTLTATDLGNAAGLRGPLDALARALLAFIRTPANRLVVSRARKAAWRSLDTRDYVDLGGFCSNLAAAARGAGGKAVREACTGVIAAIDPPGLVVRTKAGGRARERTTGATIWFPEDEPLRETTSLYEKLTLVRGTAWGRFVRAYSAG